MGKQIWKPGNMLYPLPVVMVSVADKEGNNNIITIAWAGTICTNPPMVSISVRPERHSYHILKETGEFVINLPSRELAYATDYCGVKSGRDVDKFKELSLTPLKAQNVSAPLIGECPVSIECKVKEVIPLGSHDLFVAEVLAVHADERYMDEKGKFRLEKADPIVYLHGDYFTCGEKVGSFGYSVKKSVRKNTMDKKTPDKKLTDKKSVDKKSADKKVTDKKTTGKKSADKKAATSKSLKKRVPKNKK